MWKWLNDTIMKFWKCFSREASFQWFVVLLVGIDDLCEKNLAQRLWEIFEDLLQVVIDVISKNGKVDITSFKTSPEYAMVKNLFESSFLTNQLLQINNAA